MVRAMLAAERLPDDLQALIARKAEGNPFFIEELVKSLREAGSIRRGDDGWVLTQRLDDLVVPDTIQDIIAARIDRLRGAGRSERSRPPPRSVGGSAAVSSIASWSRTRDWRHRCGSSSRWS